WSCWRGVGWSGGVGLGGGGRGVRLGGRGVVCGLILGGGLGVARRGLGQAAVEAKVVTVLLVGAVELVVDAVAARVDAAADLRLGGGRGVGVDGPRPDTGRDLAVALLVDPPGPALVGDVVGELCARGSVGGRAEGERSY